MFSVAIAGRILLGGATDDGVTPLQVNGFTKINNGALILSTAAAYIGTAAQAFIGTVNSGALFLNTPTSQLGYLAAAGAIVLAWQPSGVSVTGSLSASGAAGINGKAAVVNVAAPAAAGATFTAAEQTLLNDIRTRLINFGIYT